MTRDEVKMWLFSVKEKEQLKRAKIQELEKIADKVEGIRGLQCNVIDLNKTSKPNTNKSPTETRAIKIVDQFYERISKLENEIIELGEEVNAIKDELYSIYRNTNMTANEYEILKLYYFDGLSSAEVGMAIKYSVSWVNKLKIDGLNKCKLNILINKTTVAVITNIII